MGVPGSAKQAAGPPQSDFNGLILHSFALRLNKDHPSFPGRDNREKVEALFALPDTGGIEFRVVSAGDMANKVQPQELAPHSPLISRELTTIEPQGVAFLEREDDAYTHQLPNAFSWATAADPGEQRAVEQPWKRFIFAGREEGGPPSVNDFLVQGIGCCPGEDQARSVSKTLCQLLAHRRSMLFGLALANRFVNVMLPHAILEPVPEDNQSRHVRECDSGCWILQPLVSLIRAKQEGEGFRRTYSLSLFLIPVEGPDCEARKMPLCEIGRVVDAGWGLASFPWPAELRRFDVHGPLPGYISRLGQWDVPRLMFAAKGDEASGVSDVSGKCPPLTLRQATEAIMFAVALKMAGRSTDQEPGRWERQIGDGVVTSLGNSRVSSVVVVDDEFEKDGNAFPGSLYTLMKEISEGETRIAHRRRYRLDRSFFDSDDYAIGVLPSNNCMVIAADSNKQWGRWESALMQAGWAASMAVGAANAIGTIRGIHRDLDQVGSKPTDIADIENEVVVDLSEIYDLDITWEAYRRRYRRFRDLLGITSDYDALDRKLQALYRETGVRHQDIEAKSEANTQKRLTYLTVWIVVASVLLLIATILGLIIGK